MTDAAATPSSAPSTPAASSPASSVDESDVSANIARVVAKARAAESASEGADGTGGSSGADSAERSPTAAAETKKDAPASKPDEQPKAPEKPKGDEPDEKAPKVDEDPKMAAKFAALARKSEKVRQREDAVNAQARDIAEREQRLVAHERNLSAQAADLREFESAKADPSRLLEWMVKRGIKVESIVSHSMAEQDPALRAELTSKRALSEAEAMRKEAAAERERSQREANQIAEQRAEQEFLQVIGDETKHEAANLVYSRGEQLRVAYHLDRLAKEKGLGWGLSELAEAVNEFAAGGYELDSRGQVVKTDRYSKVRARLANGAPAPAAPAATTPVQNGSGPHATPARTLTNSDASERSQEASYEDLPLEDRVRRVASRARQATRAAM